MRENGKIQSDEVISSEKFNMPLAKIKDFLLKPGAKHSRDFFDVGYVQNDIVKLMRDIEFLFNEDNAEDNKTFPDGMERFSIFMDLGVNVKKRFRTVWQRDNKNSKPRFVTAHRE